VHTLRDAPALEMYTSEIHACEIYIRSTLERYACPREIYASEIMQQEIRICRRYMEVVCESRSALYMLSQAPFLFRDASVVSQVLLPVAPLIELSVPSS